MTQPELGSNDVLTHIQRAIVEHKGKLRPNLSLPILRDRSDRLLGVLDAMSVWVLEFDFDARLQYTSPQSEAVIGYTAEECMMSDRIQFHPDDIAGVGLASRRVRETGEIATNQLRIRHKYGHWVWIEATVSGWYDSEGGDFHTIVFIRDLTELKRAEAARAESVSRYQVVTRMSCDLIIEVDDEGGLTYVGPGSQEIVGYTAQEMQAHAPWEIIHPEDAPRIRSQLEEEFRNEGREQIDSKPIIDPQRLMELRVKHRDGHWLWFETLGLVYQRADGEKRYLGVCRDVTKSRREERERRMLEESMQRAQKLESLGVLAGGIAHDFNNLLTPILGAAGLGLKELPDDSPVHAHLQRIKKAAERAASLTDQMLAYAGQEPLGVEQLDLSKLVGEMQELVVSSVSGKTVLELALAGPARLAGDESRPTHTRFEVRQFVH